MNALPSLKGVTVARSFDPTAWQLPIHADGTDIRAGEISLCEESHRRKVAFYLDVTGEPVCQSMCPESMWFPALVARIATSYINGDRVVLHIDAALPLSTAIADVAFPGRSLSGARMADVTVVDLSGHRRTVHAEIPAHLGATGTIVLALRAVRTSDQHAAWMDAARRPVSR